MSAFESSADNAAAKLLDATFKWGPFKAAVPSPTNARPG
jgi:hypothetical protein